MTEGPWKRRDTMTILVIVFPLDGARRL